MRGRRIACLVGLVGLVGLLAWVLALAVPTVTGASADLTPVRVGIGDHPGFVRVIVDFAHGSLTKDQVEAIDPRPFDGAAGLRISHLRVRTRAVARRSHRVSVRIREGVNGLRVAIRSARTRFKYLSYTIVSENRLVIDLWAKVRRRRKRPSCVADSTPSDHGQRAGPWRCRERHRARTQPV